MSISKEEFCKIETMLTGEELNYVEQLKYKSFTGLELLEYLNDFYELYNDSKQAQALQLQQTSVIASCSNTHIGKDFVYTSGITNCKTIFKVARTEDRYGQTILISENNNRYFLVEVIPHN